MRKGRIYKITNNINGKLYIGQTIYPLSYRYTNHLSDARNGRGYAMASAIRKYGEKNFKIELIEECDEDQLNDVEIKYIKQFNSFAPNGYNLTHGGDDCFRRAPFNHDEVISKFYELKSAVKVARFYKTDIPNITDILKENKVHYGTGLSPENKNIIFNMYHSGIKPIEISKSLGLHRSTVRKFLKANGFDPFFYC